MLFKPIVAVLYLALYIRVLIRCYRLLQTEEKINKLTETLRIDIESPCGNANNDPHTDSTNANISYHGYGSYTNDPPPSYESVFGTQNLNNNVVADDHNRTPTEIYVVPRRQTNSQPITVSVGQTGIANPSDVHANTSQQ